MGKGPPCVDGEWGRGGAWRIPARCEAAARRASCAAGWARAGGARGGDGAGGSGPGGAGPPSHGRNWTPPQRTFPALDAQRARRRDISLTVIWGQCIRPPNEDRSTSKTRNP